MCLMQSSPPEESYGKDSGDQRNSFDRGDLEDKVGETFDNGSMDPDKIDHGVHLHGADDGAEEHHRHKRQAMVDWTWRRSMVSKISFCTIYDLEFTGCLLNNFFANTSGVPFIYALLL